MENTEYQQPGFFTTQVFNRMIRRATKMGISVMGSRVLEHKGRKSGATRTTPVNLLSYRGQEYLVSPRGESEWVRNVRADQGRLVLTLGRRSRSYVVQELEGEEKLQVLDAYLKKWAWEVGAFFHGVKPGSDQEAWLEESRLHPVFRLTPA